MALNLAPAALFWMASGALLMALGVFVAAMRPRTRAGVAFGLFALLWGSRFIALRIFTLDDPLRQVGQLVGAAAQILALPALLYFALHFPKPLSPSERRFARALLVGGIVYVGVAIVVITRLIDGLPWTTRVEVAAQTTIILPQPLVVFLLARRARHEPEPAIVQQYVLMSAALLVFPLVAIGDEFRTPLFYALGVAGPFLAAAAWLRNARGGVASAAARNLAIAVPALLLVSAVRSTFFRGFLTDATFAAAGLVCSVLILAYAILRVGMFGLDVKVRWTLRQSTIGVVFVAVFFVATELAQIFSSEAVGPYIGVFVAGSLVFVMAPLQRLAERVAASAVPTAAGPEADVERRREAYRGAVALALADGVLSREEERHLAKLASVLRIDPEEALAIRERVEAEHPDA